MPTATDTATAPQERRFTVDEYYRMGEAGIFGEDDRVELLDGQIYVMSPIGSEHAACVRRLNRLFQTRAGKRALVSIQSPIRLGDNSEPEPDLALLHPREDDYATRHPRPKDVFLLVEVAETFLSFDQEVKRPLYAEAGIPEYWIVDLKTPAVHVYRDPAGDTYRTHTTYGLDDELEVANLPDCPPLSTDPVLLASD